MSPRDHRPHNIPCAGGLLWRRAPGGELQVLMVHRPKYDDWSWPKGKLDPGETWVGAGAREVWEETGLRPRFSVPLPPSAYRLPRGAEKVVRYWAGTTVGGTGELVNEIDEIAWVSPQQAREQLTMPRLTEQLDGLLAADERGELDTWPLAVVRHGSAGRRSAFKGPDAERPLDKLGAARAEAIASILRAFDILSLLTSPSERCLQTLLPYATLAQLAIRTKKGLSEEGYAADGGKAVKHVTRLLDAGIPAAVCTHRPVLPAILALLSEHCAPGSRVEAELNALVTRGMEKGEVLVCHVKGSGPAAQVLAAERFRPSAPGY